MKQILASLKTGQTESMDVPCPQLQAGHVLICTSASLISKGTEKMLVDFGKSSLLQKARQQPERVRMVVDKVKVDGLWSTLETVRNKLDQLLPMGYCNVGTVLAVADDISEFAVGDRVVSNGPHAEVVMVAKNLCCKVPLEVTDEEAAFTILGAIALQGIRLAAPMLGECFVVMGLGLVGLLTVQLLKAHGCRVLGIDIDKNKVDLAKTFGVDASLAEGIDLLQTAQHFSRERGVDGVIVTATTKSSEPLHIAAQMCRKRGRIILVGVTGLALSRADFYAKELIFQVSCSYGPGRYDPAYEIAGHDYPIGWVRFTEQRNFEAFLDLLASRKMNIVPLITHRFAIADAHLAYEVISNDRNSLGIVLTYKNPMTDQLIQHKTLSLTDAANEKYPAISVGMIGAGNYAGKILIPLIKKQDVICHTIGCSGGVSGTQMGRKYGFRKVTTDVEVIFADREINTVVIASRHDTHATFVEKAIAAQQHIFVEKPLCLTLAELDRLKEPLTHFNKVVMIGFNRRFAPHTYQIKQLLAAEQAPKTFIMTVNGGAISKDHWTQDKLQGGGRVIGEACHFIDLLRHLANASIASFTVTKLSNENDTVTITLSFADGSMGTIHYLANGHRLVPKERLEIFTSGKVLQLDNFRKLRGYGWMHFDKLDLWRQDKGQANCVNSFIKAIKEAGPSPIPLDEIIEVSKLTIDIANAL